MAGGMLCQARPFKFLVLVHPDKINSLVQATGVDTCFKRLNPGDIYFPTPRNSRAIL